MRCGKVGRVKGLAPDAVSLHRILGKIRSCAVRGQGTPKSRENHSLGREIVSAV